jgi:hypothetical protein
LIFIFFNFILSMSLSERRSQLKGFLKVQISSNFFNEIAILDNTLK